ncbi:hypothetical protein [Caulobacter hibisci]|uniref:Uncharacterized protein n=1 Tax=Caulobacter hibisci TaxID=2035993 RepID=A0ABS0STT5_9CAUL|nr:hypothetical protein [Caulobacter hibisci]MBI1683075.1 hypothetical protein [Caulobacter hibisci]
MRAILAPAVCAGLLGLMALPSPVTADTGYAGVWRPGGGAQWWRSGMTLDQFKAQDKTHFDNGLRLRRCR